MVEGVDARPPQVLSRRALLDKLLKTAAVGTVTALPIAGSIADIFSRDRNVPQTPVRTSSLIPADVADRKSTPQTTPTPHEQKTPVSMVIKKNEIESSDSLVLSENDLSVIFTSPAAVGERSIALKKVTNQVKEYIKQRGIDKNVKSMEEWVGVTNKVCDMFGDAVDPRLRAILPGLIFAESKGDRYAQTVQKVTKVDSKTKAESTQWDVVAEGLAQLKPSTAHEEYTRLDEKFKSLCAFKVEGKGKKYLNLFDPQTNIALSTWHLNGLLRTYPDPAIAVWAYHFGQGNVNTLIRDYAQFSHIPQDTINTYLDNPKLGVGQVMKELGITYGKLMNWFEQHMGRLKYKPDLLNSTQNYTSSVEAGGWLVKNRDAVIAYRAKVDGKKS